MKLAHKLSHRHGSLDGQEDPAAGHSSGGEAPKSNLRASSHAGLRSPSGLRTLSHARVPGSRKDRKDERKARRAATRKHAHGGELSDSEDEAAFRADWHMSRREEKAKMEEFLQALKEQDSLRTHFDWYTYRRFLRARQHNIPNAVEMWRNHLEWRAEIGADTILEDFEFPERDNYISLYPQGYCNVDKQGRPVYIQQLGHLQFKKLCELTSEERMLKFHVQEYERCVRYILPACSKAAGRRVEQTFAILDVKGVGLRHLTGDIKKMLQQVIQVDQNNYPEMLGKTAIINAGSIVNWVFPIVRPFLDKRTQNKIEVCPKDFKPTLLQYIDEDQLPEYLGGTSKATLLDDAGPWNNQAFIDEIDADLKKGGPRLRMPDDAPGSVAGSSVAGSSPKAQMSYERGVQNGARDGRITEEEESFFESQTQANPALSAPSMASAISGPGDEGFDSATEGGYASASEGGYYSAAESVRSASRASSFGPLSSASRPLFSRQRSRDSDSDDEAQSRSPIQPAAATSPSRAGGYSALPTTSPPTSPPANGRAAGGLSAAQPPQQQPAPSRAPGPLLHQSIAARVKSLEQRLSAARQGLGRRMPPVVAEVGSSAPLLARVEALEAALDVVLASQQQIVEEEEQRQKSRGCCGCCIM